jgi:DNA repair protein RadA/Sms
VSKSTAAGTPQPLGVVADVSVGRIACGIGELDRVTGGGIVPGAVLLVGGEPGIGKSTLLLQLAAGVGAGRERRVLYASGEESGAQVRLRADRLGLLAGPARDAIHVLAESEVGAIVEAARAMGPTLLVVDSVQTLRSDELDGPAGSVGQVRETAGRLAEFAKAEDVAVILVGHVTKDGSLAGPKTLEHLVDAVLTLEGDRYASLRILRAAKNRFGSTDEVGVFEMSEAGLVEVVDPTAAFIVRHDAPVAGSVVAPTMEGSRPLAVEVQALVSPAGAAPPRRTTSGVDPNRMALLLAVLGRHAGIALGSHDVYANVAGGLTVTDRALDLPLSIAIASSARNVPVRQATVAVGEVGLLGELRAVAGLERRLREADRIGFQRAIVPADGPAIRVDGALEIVMVATLRAAIEAALDRGRQGDEETMLGAVAMGSAMLG